MKIYYLPLVIFSNSLLAQASNPNAFAFPSVNNNFLGKTNSSGTDVGVDYYTGAAQVDIPICALPSRDVKIPVSLNYVDGKGVKLHEYASQVGLGWQLDAGGCITRVVRCFPDEQENGYLGTGTQPSGALPAGQQWGKLIVANPSKSTMTNAEQFAVFGGAGNGGGIPTADGEPDLFCVKTPFFSFQFVFNANGVPVFSNTNGYKIISTNFYNSTNYFNSSFEIIDDQGNQFYFGSSSQSRESNSDSLYSVPYIFISTWYLDKIVTYNSKDNISLTYQAATTNDTTYSYSWSESTCGSQNLTLLNTGRNIITQPKYVSTIVSSLGELDFNYAFTRQDDHNAPSLSSIVMKGYNPQTLSNSSTLQTYNFNYGYFGTPSTDPNVLRLSLNSVTVTGSSTNTSTPLTIASFGYYTTYNLPNRTWLAFDYWGYCNTVTNPPASYYTYIYDEAETPYAVYAQADILNSVTTTQGGSWNITYESNSITGTTVGGLRVNKISHNTTGQTLYKTYQYIDNNGVNSGQIYTPLYNSLSFPLIGCTLYLSASPFILNDINGDFIGYSWVKENEQNGGYTFYNFSNFNDAVDADTLGNKDISTIVYQNMYGFNYYVSSTSLAYKRGLLLAKKSYNASGTLLLQSTNTYAPENHSSTDAAAYAIWILTATTQSTQANFFGYDTYSTPLENYRLVQTNNQQFDQVTTTNSLTTTTNYTYDHLSDPLNNNRLVDTISTIDSKGLSHIQSYYYNVDVSKTPGIPMITSPETTAINTMNSNNKTNVVIHSIDNRNGTINQVHNSYASFSYGLATRIYQANSAYYTSDPINTANTLVNQKSYYYDASPSNLISGNNLGGFYNSVSFGYNLSLPIAKVENANSTVAYSNQPQSQIGYITVPGHATGTYQATFTTFTSGTITIAMPTGSYLAGSVTCYFSYTLIGPLNESGNLCNSSVSGYTCPSSNSYSYNNAPAGTYTLSVSVITNTANSNVTVSYSYTGFQVIATPSTEFFFEGFEENGGATSGNAHTGNMYYNTNYTVPYTPPNGRKYLIQWWNLAGGLWNFNQQTYTTNMVLTGPLDDVRVFPSDGLITTYTYNPLAGATSKTDPSGRTESYQYDGLGRLNIVRDNDGNITKKYCYNYTGQSNACPANTTINSQYNISYVAWNIALTNISTGTIYNLSEPYYVGSNTNIGTVPAGNYNVSITQVGGSQTHYIYFGPYYQAGTSMSLTNVPVVGTININIPD